MKPVAKLLSRLSLTGLMALVPFCVQAAPEPNPWNAWMTQALQREPARQKALVQTYENLMRLSPEDPFVEDGHLTLLQVNLDQSPQSEVLALVGRRDSDVDLVVFVQTAQGWEPLDREKVETWYDPPELGVLSTGRQPAFFVRQLEERGTGIYQESYELYKLQEGRMLHVLHVPLDSRIYGWGLAVNQDISGRLHGLSDNSIKLDYSYRYFAGPAAHDLSWDSHEESVCLQGEEEIVFHWDPVRLRYVTDPDAQLKLQSFETLGDVRLFVRAFATELAEHRKSANKLDQVCLKRLPKP